MGRGQALTPSPPRSTPHPCRFRTLAPGPRWPGGGVGALLLRARLQKPRPRRLPPPPPPQPLPGAGEKATWCLGEVPSLGGGGGGAHAAVYSVPVLLEAHPPPPDSVGHPRAASSEEARGGEPSGTRPEASAAPGPGRAGKLEVSNSAFLF